jgi:hypothetical protein
MTLQTAVIAAAAAERNVDLCEAQHIQQPRVCKGVLVAQSTVLAILLVLRSAAGMLRSASWACVSTCHQCTSYVTDTQVALYAAVLQGRCAAHHGPA